MQNYVTRTCILISLCALAGFGAKASANIEVGDSCRKVVRSIAQIEEAGFCDSAEVLQECVSDGASIHHSDFLTSAAGAKRVLVMGVFHGDEPHTAAVPFLWFKRLKQINPRNTWRFIPVINPVGLSKQSRGTETDADINRNFPTKDWGRAGWAKRRNPGKGPASEWETRCALAHIRSFNPDMVVAVHAPYGILDFDGPKTWRMPDISALPSRRLGTYPGSLGRYLWVERGIPVLTVELPAPGRFVPEKDLILLQDWIGTVAKRYRKEKP